MQTKYARWLVDACKQGNWLKTSAVAAQVTAKPKRRVEIDVPALVPPVPDELCCRDRYTVLWRKRWVDSIEHINYKEGRVALSSLKRSVRVQSLSSCKKVTLSANLVCTSAFGKGRSKVWAMNRLCRQSAAYQFISGIQWRIRHIETLRNPADKPSRVFEPRSAQPAAVSRRKRVAKTACLNAVSIPTVLHRKQHDVPKPCVDFPVAHDINSSTYDPCDSSEKQKKNINIKPDKSRQGPYSVGSSKKDPGRATHTSNSCRHHDHVLPTLCVPPAGGA